MSEITDNEVTEGVRAEFATIARDRIPIDFDLDTPLELDSLDVTALLVACEERFGLDNDLEQRLDLRRLTVRSISEAVAAMTGSP